MTLTVTKRDNSVALLDISKIHSMLEKCCENLNVSISQIEMNSQIQFYDKIKTDDIQNIIIKSAVDLISLRFPDYQYAAARLLLTSLRKKVFGAWDSTPLLSFVRNNSANGYYQSDLEGLYSAAEWAELDKEVDHTKDFNFTHAGLEKVIETYLVKNRVTGEIRETPQIAYMLIAAVIFSEYPAKTRLQYVKDFYQAISNHEISLATPILAGVRTPTKQYSSCVLMKAGDSRNSIFATNTAMGYAVTEKSGIGLGVGDIRAKGSSVRGGEYQHTGAVGFMKMYEATLNACSQGGLRKGSATLFYPFWHKDAESFLVLKNIKGTEENRVRKVDFAIGLSKIFYERVIRKQNLTLFDPNQVPQLKSSFGLPEFDALYLAAELDDTLNKTTVSATEFFATLLTERAETGRYYIYNADHFNEHNPFTEQLTQSNLCVAPETKILTKAGYQEIQVLAGQKVELWNGEEWSESLVEQTGSNQKLISVYIDTYEKVECTPEHKFYVVTGAVPAKGKPAPTKEVKASELRVGDKLSKFDLPIIEGTQEFELAYAKGIFTGDGSNSGGIAHVDLYGKKKELLKYLPVKSSSVNDSQDRIRVILAGITLKDKFCVPNSSHYIKDRIKWFAGLVDADGHLCRKGTSYGIQIASVDLDFLKEVKLMLQTLGANAKILFAMEGGMRLLPNHKDGYSEYLCQDTYRLTLSTSALEILIALGLRDEIHNHNFEFTPPSRQANKYSKITAVLDESRVSDTYCFNEPSRHMGMFNGFLAGNCMEVALPVKEFDSLDDENGEIASCILSAINTVKVIGKPALYKRLCELAVRALDSIVDLQKYAFIMQENSAKRRRSIGIGYINIAYSLAKQDLKLDSPEALQYLHELSESLQFYTLEASHKLAVEQGKCEYFDRTKYSQGILPIDTYKKDIDAFAPFALLHDWEALRKNILKDGLRNSTLTAIMPSESSSLVSNATNGIEFPRHPLQVKSNGSSRIKILVPEFNKLKYEYLWAMQSNTPYLKMVAVIQKFIDQSISANTSYNPLMYLDNKVPMKVIMEDVLNAYKWGVKALYYHNTFDGNIDSTSDSGCSSGACAI